MNNIYSIIIILVFSFTLVCNGQIINRKELKKEVKENVRNFRIENVNNNKQLVFLSFVDDMNSKESSYMMQRVNSLSVIYKFHISFITFVDNIPVIISSEKDGFIDVKNIDNKVISLLTKYLEDDLLMNSIIIINMETLVRDTIKGDSYMLSPADDSIILDHGKPWKIMAGITHKKWNKHTLEEGFMFWNENYDNSTYYRVIEGGIDDRKFNLKN